MSRRVAQQHGDWLRLVDVSGPFLSLTAVQQAFPHGLDPEEQGSGRLFSQALDELRGQDASVATYNAFVDLVVRDVLGYGAAHDQRGANIADLFATQPGGSAIRPTALLGERENPTRAILLVVAPRGESLTNLTEDGSGRSSWEERSRLLARATGIPCVLLTNGDVWTIVYAGDIDRPTTYARFVADVLSEDRVLFRAFSSLLSCERLLGAGDTETLGALLASSKDEEIDLTKQLGVQARRAVEMIVYALDLHDANHEGALSKYIKTLYPNRPAEEVLYEGAVVTLMRLMFLLAAEDRGLLPDDEPWREGYAVGGMLPALRSQDEAVLERRYDAWGRLSSTFRAIFYGVDHEAVRLPGYGGDLFDPGKYGFLERDASGAPVNVSNNVVLQVLREVQEAEVKAGGLTERRILSYRALSVEQLGYVYEGLLDHTATRAGDVVLGLEGPSESEVELSVLETKIATSQEALVEFLRLQTGRSKVSLEKALAEKPSEYAVARAEFLLGAQPSELERVRPWLSLVPQAQTPRPWLIPNGRAYVTLSEGRSQSSSFYTPRVLTDSIIKQALDPLCFLGVSEGLPESEWALRSAGELTSLRICDIAMGSGAFLVAAARYLGALVSDAWERDPASAPSGTSADPEFRLWMAKRLVVEQCLFGVDRNFLAVEMAKLSLWLETLQKGRPFSFVDHALRVGDSLLGVSSVRELESLSLKTSSTLDVLGDVGRRAVERELRAIAEVRSEIAGSDALDLVGVEGKRRLLREVEARAEILFGTADLVAALTVSRSAEFRAVATEIGDWASTIALTVESGTLPTKMKHEIDGLLAAEAAPGDRLVPDPFHWPIAFPEVFVDRGGFDAVVGNPPYLGGTKISSTFGPNYREVLVQVVADGARGSADLSAYFVLRAVRLVNDRGAVGLVTTNSIAQGFTREVGLDRICKSGWNIYSADSNRPWPGDAVVVVSTFSLSKQMPARFDARLAIPSRVAGQPLLLSESERAFQGTIVTGPGFLLNATERSEIELQYPGECEVIRPFVSGDDIANSVGPKNTRWAIDFGDMSHDEATRYPGAYKRIEELVKPFREKSRQADIARTWWQFQSRRAELYSTISGYERVLVGPRTAKWWFVCWLPAGWIYSDTLNVFAVRSDAKAGVLSSSWHEAWARRWSGSNNDRLRYSPTQCLENFPMPNETQSLEQISAEYFEARSRAQLELGVGLTDLYNKAYEEISTASDVVIRLRELRVALDLAVLAAFGWDDLVPDHQPRQVDLAGSAVHRFAVSAAVQQEVQDRLLETNHQRGQAESQARKSDEPERSGRTRRRPHLSHEAQTEMRLD